MRSLSGFIGGLALLAVGCVVMALVGAVVAVCVLCGCSVRCDEF